MYSIVIVQFEYLFLEKRKCGKRTKTVANVEKDEQTGSEKVSNSISMK
jgi:hypothetical protein